MLDKPRHFVVGDTHGNDELVRRLIEAINYDPSRDYVYFLGDYYPHYNKEGKPSGDIFKLMELLNRYYTADITNPGFHLIRGNNEWKGIRFNDVFGNIMIAACPDIVVLKIEGHTFCLSHCGMEKDLWDKIKNYDNAEFFLSDTQSNLLFSAIVNERKNNITSFSDKSKNEVADYFPRKDGSTWFIHGHLPSHKDIKAQGCYNYEQLRDNYYKEFGMADSGKQRGYIRQNTLRNALNIDTGAEIISNDKFCACLACVYLEDFIKYLDDKQTQFCYYVF